MSVRRATWTRRWRRAKLFAKQYSQNRSGLVGLILLSLFAITAIFAPQIAPYVPTSQSASNAAAPFVPPEWTRVFNPSLSTNQLQFYDQFASGDDGWTFHSNTTFPADYNVSTSGGYDPNVGFVNPYGAKTIIDPGSFSMALIGQNSTKGINATEIYMEKSFAIPAGSPAGLTYSFDYFVSGQYNVSLTPKADVSIVTPAGEEHSLAFNLLLFYDRANVWQIITPEKVTDINIVPQIFTGPGTYKIRLSLTFNPLDTGSYIRYRVWFDRIRLLTYGQVFGIMGADNQGRDVWSFLVYGTRVSFLVGILATVVSLGIGMLIGLTSGYTGGYADELIMRGTDFFLVLPGLPLLIVFAAILGPNIWNIILIIAILGWPGVARVIRSQTLTVKERTFVEAAKALGASRIHILFKHILPNVLALVFALGAGAVGGAIVFEAALSFLGLGDPTVTSWGQILEIANQNGAGPQFWWLVVPPGLAIALLSISFIFIGYALDEIVNPKLRAR